MPSTNSLQVQLPSVNQVIPKVSPKYQVKLTDDVRIDLVRAEQEIATRDSALAQARRNYSTVVDTVNIK